MFSLIKSIMCSNIFHALRSEFIRELVFLPIGVYGFSYMLFIDYVMLKAVFSGRLKLLETQKILRKSGFHVVPSYVKQNSR